MSHAYPFSSNVRGHAIQPLSAGSRQGNPRMTKRIGRMRALACIAALAIARLSSPLAWQAGAASEQRTIFGRAVTADGQPIPGATLRLREATTGTLIETTSTTDIGTFSVGGLEPGQYVIELVGRTGILLGAMPVYLAPGASSLSGVTVMARSAAARGLGQVVVGGAKGFFGSALGGVTLAAVGAGLTAGTVATRGDATPKR
jgi:hypothetical protein